jgi:hypothetical protein|uniref:Uncharacterized protein n=1 Tax=Sipha flava TaxID=143950 RepID=A0A2S2Q382_9HEMI
MIQSIPPSKKDMPKKVILEKDMAEKNVPEKEMPEKAYNEDVQLQGITAVVPFEVFPTLATWLFMWPMQGEVLWFSIMLSREVKYNQESLLTASKFMGIFSYAVKDAVAKARTTSNGSGDVVVFGPFVVAHRFIWTWSMADIPHRLASK